MAGVGALSALLFARSAVLAARATNQQQRAQIEALERSEAGRAEEARARYASRFICWVTSKDDLPTIVVVDPNDVPMYRVTVYAGSSLGTVFARYTQIGPVVGRRYLGRVGRALSPLLSERGWRTMLNSGVVWTTMSFRDPAGQWWCRDESGLLHRVGAEDEALEICRRPAERVDPGTQLSGLM